MFGNWDWYLHSVVMIAFEQAWNWWHQHLEFWSFGHNKGRVFCILHGGTRSHAFSLSRPPLKSALFAKTQFTIFLAGLAMQEVARNVLSRKENAILIPKPPSLRANDLHNYTTGILLLRLRIKHLTLRTQPVTLRNQIVNFLSPL